MRAIWTICFKELKSYFTSPIGWLLMTIWAFLSGYFFWTIVQFTVRSGARAMMMGGPTQINVNEYVIRPLLQNTCVMGLFLIPLITMRLFAEEKRQGTMELLLTSPISDFALLFGKWLSAVLMYTAMVVFPFLSFAFLFAYSNPDWRPLAVGLFGLILQAGAILSLGLFISTTTKNQIVAGGLTFGVSLLLWVFEWTSGLSTEAWAKVLSYMSLISHYESFSKGVIDSRDVIYYVTLTVFGLFLTSRSLESLRWRA